MQKEQKEKPRGYWSERLPNGEKRICFRVKRNGKKDTVKLSLEEIENFLKQA